jgi:hypothetical protein
MKYEISLGPFEAVTIMFIGLKLTNHIDWSWWVVFAPLLIPVLLCAFVSALRFLLKSL